MLPALKSCSQPSYTGSFFSCLSTDIPAGQLPQAAAAGAAPLKPVYARLPSLQSLVVDVGAIPPGAASAPAEDVIMLPRMGQGAAAGGLLGPAGGGGGGLGAGSSSTREGEAVLMQLLLPVLRGMAAPGQPGAQVRAVLS
jgi:hypothetical protein